MDTVIESERKYDTPKEFALPDLAGCTGDAGVQQVGEPQIHELDATYFDTDDLRLARNRMTLRRRTGGTDAGWHLKTPAVGDDRTEQRVPLDDGTAGAAEQVPAELLALVRSIVRDRPLRPVARLRTRRREYPLQDGAGRVLALLADDRVRADADGDEQRWREVEVELVDGDRAVLTALDERLRAAGARPASGPSKLARALGDRLQDAIDGIPGAGGCRQPAPVRAVLDYVAAQRDAIVANDPAVRRGDPSAVHAMRVATRRLRSTLRTFRDGMWDREQTEALRDELSWLADRLGGVRDHQVMTARLHRAVTAEPPELVVGPVDTRIREQLDQDLDAGRQSLGEALDGSRYFAVLDALDHLVDNPPRSRVPGRWIRRQAAKALQKADALLDGATNAPAPAGQDDPEGTDTERHHRDEGLHDARKAYKRARYAVEVFGPIEGAPARRLVKRLTGLQDVLGDHQDSVITAELLRDYAGRAHAAGENGFSYGVLYVRQLAAGEEMLTRLPAARRAAGNRKLRRWLR